MKIKSLFLALLIAALGGSLCAQTPSGAYSSPASGSGSSSSGAGSSINTINVTASPYNVPVGNSCASGAVHITSGSNNVTCDNYTFTSADVGKIIFETCCGGTGGQAKATSVLHLAQGVINSVVSAHVAAVCTTTGACTPVNATATDNGTSGAILIFGNDGTTGMTAAIAAAYGQSGPCPGIQLPVGLILVTSSFGSNATPTCTAPVGNVNDSGLTVFGQGRNSSMIVPVPSFNFATCTGLGTQAGCFFSVNGIDRKNFGIWGGEVGACTGAPHTVSIVSATTDDFDWNLAIAGWCAADTSMWGYLMEGPGAYPEDPVVDGGGGIGIVVTNAGSGPYNNLVGCFSGDNKGSAAGEQPGNVWVKVGATLSAEGCMWGTAVASGSNAVLVDGTFIDSNGVYLPFQTGTNGLVVGTTGVARVNGMRFTTANGANGAFVFNGGKLYASNSVFNGSASSSVNVAAGGTFFDGGGNTYTSGVTGVAPTCAATTGGTGCALVAGSSNEKGTVRITASAVATGTVTLTFAGTFSGATSTTPDCTFNYANTGTGAWSLTTTTPIVLTTRSTTAPVFNWNQTAALTAASTYDIDYVCQAR